MTCPQCGLDLTGNARFCSRCGTDVQRVEEKPTQRTDRLQHPDATQPPANSNVYLGRVIDDKYRIDGLLGQGGMGAVYSATRLLIDDQVAVKVLHPEQVSEAQSIERFRREAQAAARLKHPNAVTIYDFGVSTDKLVYLVMELVEGRSLRAILRQQGPMSPTVAAEIISQVCAALDEAHRNNIVHRDLKPDNVIVTETQSGLRVKVLDFGIAKMHDVSASANALTQTGAVMGTPHYMSPEQCMGDGIDGRSDIYSLGVMLFEMLTGTVPFNSSTPTAIIVQHVNQQPPPLRQINASIPVSVERVVIHAMAKQRDSRPQSARALAMELNDALSVNATLPPSPAANPTSHGLYGGTAAGLAPTVQIKTPTSGSSRMANGAPQPFMDGSPQTPWSGAETPYAPPKKRAWPIAIILSLLIIAAGAVAVYFLIAKKVSTKEGILQEIRRGNLVKPEGSSAYDLYQKNVGTLSVQDKTEITNLATSQLEKRGTDIIARLKMEEDVSEADWAESVRVYSWLNELKPGSTNEARKFFSSGRLSFEKKDFNKAREEMDRSIQAEPNWAMSLNAMGRIYVQLQKSTGDNSYFSRADEYYGRAVEAEPTWVLPLINRASLRYQRKDYFHASTFIRQAIAMEPNRPNSHKLYGDILLMQNQPCQAKTEYQIALDNVPANSYPIWLEPVRQEVTRINNRYRCSEMGL